MNDTGDSLNWQDWVDVAGQDWHRIGVMLDDGDADAAAYFLQQSLEKYLKAFLLRNGWRLKKVHELDALLDDAVRFDPTLERFRDLCERIAEYYFSQRYPKLAETNMTCAMVQNDLPEAKEFVQTLEFEVRH